MSDPAGIPDLLKSVGLAATLFAVFLGAFMLMFRRVLKHLDDVVPVLQEIRDSLRAMQTAADHGRTEAVVEIRETVREEADRVIREVKPLRGVRP